MTVAVPINPDDDDREDRHSQEGRRPRLFVVPSQIDPDASSIPMSCSDPVDFERLLPDRRVIGSLLRLVPHYGVRVEPEAARRNENR